METKRFYDLKTIISFVVLLIISSLVLGKFGYWGSATLIMCPTQADYGFPFSFVTHCESFASGEIRYGFNVEFLIMNLLIWYIFALIIISVYSKFKK